MRLAKRNRTHGISTRKSGIGMVKFQRVKIDGAIYLFAVNLLERQGYTLLAQKIDTLRDEDLLRYVADGIYPTNWCDNEFIFQKPHD